MKNDFAPLLDVVDEYYSAKLRAFGPNSRGADWNSDEGQTLRFHQLAKIISGTEAFTLCDYGCGYAALFEYLKQNHSTMKYLGIDISAAMIDQAKRLHPQAEFRISSTIDYAVDYIVASGIFNVRLDRSASEWEAYIEHILNHFNEFAVKGFSFNCLTSYSDHDHRKDTLHYVEPEKLFSLCKKKFSKNVALLHDYNLYEFTILVRK